MGESAEPEADEKAEAAGPTETAGPPILQWASIIGVAATFIATLATALLTHQTQSIVNESSHAQEFERAFATNAATITSFMHSKQRTDEQEADLALTALNDFAQSLDDKIAILTIAARMLNATDCPGSGEATARFLTIVVEHLKAERSPDDVRLLEFVRSRAFKGLASDDVTTVYFNDDNVDDSNFPIGCGSTTTAVERKLASDSSAPHPSASASGPHAAVPTPEPTPTPAPRPPLYTPGVADQRNHATYWGERAIWAGARTQLFRELRDDNYVGWIHVATWERPDACVDDTGQVRLVLDPKTKRRKPVLCTAIRVSYASTPFVFAVNDPSNLRAPFWLGRARFLRDAPPHIYEHKGETTPLNLRGTLGLVIGTVENGECVMPLGRPVYAGVSPRDEPRHFVHVWVKVRAAPRSACWPDEADGGS